MTRRPSGPQDTYLVTYLTHTDREGKAEVAGGGKHVVTRSSAREFRGKLLWVPGSLQSAVAGDSQIRVHTKDVKVWRWILKIIKSEAPSVAWERTLLPHTLFLLCNFFSNRSYGVQDSFLFSPPLIKQMLFIPLRAERDSWIVTLAGAHSQTGWFLCVGLGRCDAQQKLDLVRGWGSSLCAPFCC